MKITITGPAQAYDLKSEEPVVDGDRLAKLDGLHFDEMSCVDYLDPLFIGIGIEGGFVELKYPGDGGKLAVVTVYETARKLKNYELDQLLKETTGQWSDGIGEGEFKHRDEHGLDIVFYPMASGDKPKVEQIKSDVKVKKPKSNPLVKMLDVGQAPVDEAAAIQLIEDGVALDGVSRYGRSILSLAVLKRLPRVVALLIESGAFSDLPVSQRGDIMYMLGVSAYTRDPDAPTPEEQAALEETVEVAKLLLDAGFDVNEYDVAQGCNALIMAVNRNNLPLVKYLLSRGADVNSVDKKECNHNLVLYYAKHPTIVKYLLDQGTDPNIKNESGRTVLELFQQFEEEPAIVDLLLQVTKGGA